jgi:signal transduction histidine kinase
MRLDFRARLVGVVGVTAVALAVIFATSSVLSARVERQLDFIQQRYVPKLELEPRLESRLEHLARAFQDAVAAHDVDALEATREDRDALLASLADAGDAVDPTDAEALRGALRDYWTRADDLSRRLIAGETGEALPDAIAAMQASQARTVALIKRTAAIDQADMAEAFRGASRAEATARRTMVGVGLLCFVAVLTLSMGLGRGLVRSLSAVTEGFGRFGRGDFSQPIPTTSRDALGDLARDANAMAASLDRLVTERRQAEVALAASNRELEAFSYSVAHDLRAPLRAINGFSGALCEDYGKALDAEALGYLSRITAATHRMGDLIDALLGLSRVARGEFRRELVDLSRLAEGVGKQLQAANADRAVDFRSDKGVVAQGDAALLRIVLENLIGNAWKFTGKTEGAAIAFGVEQKEGARVYYVRDNGAGFDMAYAAKLFAPFQRLHTDRDFAGTGIGLATVQRIVQRHGGRIWADGVVGRGAMFRFTLESAEDGVDS